MPRYTFLLDTYDTERLKTLSVWSLFRDEDLRFRPEPRARTPHEQMVHQCVSEDTWMKTMLGIDLGEPPLPPEGNPPAGPAVAPRGDPPRLPPPVRRCLGPASRTAARDAGRVVRGRHPLLRRRAQPGLGAGAADRARGASPGPAPHLPALPGEEPLFDLRPHRGHRGPVPERRPNPLSLSEPRPPPGGRGRRG